MSTFGTQAERAASAAYHAAYAESLHQYQQDGDHAAFSARNKTAADAYHTAVAPAWAAAEATLGHIDDERYSI